MLFFEYHRGYIAERAVAPRRVVERLDVIEDGKLSVTATVRNRLIQSGVGLQSAPERFHRRVVVAITSAAHAPFNASDVERVNVVAVDILAAAIRVMEESCGGLPTLQGIGEGGQDETGMQGGRTGPADDFAAPQIEDGRQIKPAFGRFQVGDVGQPTLIGAGGSRTLGDEIGRDRLSMAAVGGLRLTSVFLAAA